MQTFKFFDLMQYCMQLLQTNQTKNSQQAKLKKFRMVNELRLQI